MSTHTNPFFTRCNQAIWDMYWMPRKGWYQCILQAWIDPYDPSFLHQHSKYSGIHHHGFRVHLSNLSLQNTRVWMEKLPDHQQRLGRCPIHGQWMFFMPEWVYFITWWKWTMYPMFWKFQLLLWYRGQYPMFGMPIRICLRIDKYGWKSTPVPQWSLFRRWIYWIKNPKHRLQLSKGKYECGI